MGKLTTFGLNTVYDFSALAQQDLDVRFGNRVRASERMVMASGGFDRYGISPSPSEVGTVQLSITLTATDRDDMEDKREALAAIQGYGLTMLKYQETDETQDVKFCFARCTNVSMPQKLAGHSDLFQSCTVSFEVPYPIWHTEGKASGILDSTFVWGGSVWGGNPDEIAASDVQTDGTTTNNGTAVTLPIISIVCGASETCEYPIIQRLVDSVVVDEVSVDVIVGNNETLTINARRRSVDLEGVDQLGVMDFLHPAWFRIYPGVNNIRVLFTNMTDAATVQIEYYEDFYGA